MTGGFLPDSRRFVGDDDLGYMRQRAVFGPGSRLVLDEAYRSNQLPLLNPDHPRVIARPPGTETVLGRHAGRRLAVVAWIAPRTLEESVAYRDLVGTLRDSPVAAKIDWRMAEFRRDLLHATLWSRLELTMDVDEARQRLSLARGSGSIEIVIGGFWMGSAFNRGRIYLPLYPERRQEGDALALLQRRLGGRETGVYAVGLFNLVDDLDEAETAALAQVIGAAEGRIVAETTIREIALIETHDDLALSGRTVDVAAL